MYLRFMANMGIRTAHIRGALRGRIKDFFKNESGMGTLEVIIIIAVLVALALLFRNFIMDLAGLIFDKIQAKTDSTINSL